MVVKSKNEVVIIILVLIFIVVNFGFLAVALDVGLNPIHEENMSHMKGIMLGRRIPFSPGNFLGTGSPDLVKRRGPAKDATAGSGS